jgi:ABC-type uncharacterized transport system permease subunit
MTEFALIVAGLTWPALVILAANNWRLTWALIDCLAFARVLWEMRKILN